MVAMHQDKWEIDFSYQMNEEELRDLHNKTFLIPSFSFYVSS